MLRIFNIILKDLKLLFRSKSSAFIAILSPLLIVFLVSIGFNTSSFSDLRLGVYSESYSNLSDSLITQLETHFSVIKTESKDDCIRGIKSGKFHVCTTFPKDLSVESNDSIIFYVDYSRINFVYNILDTISEELKTKSTELSLELTRVLVQKLNEAKVEISGKKSTVNSLSSNNDQVKGKLSSADSSLGSLDLTYDSGVMNLTNLKDQVSSVESNYNTSLSALRTSITTAESTLTSLTNKLSSASASRDNIVKDIDDINSVISQNSNDINSVSDSFNKIVNSIEGIKYTEAETIVTPLKTKIEPLMSGKSNLSYLFPTLLILIVMFISMLFSSTMVVREKTSRAYFRNFITPTNEFIFFICHYLTNILIVASEALLVLVISMIFMGFSFLLPGLNIFVALILVASFFVFVGMTIGYLFKTNETANLAAISIASMFLFFSNTILPLESLPSLLRNIVKYNPFVVSEEIIKRILLFDSNIIVEWQYILILLGFAVVFLGISFLAKELTKRRLA